MKYRIPLAAAAVAVVLLGAGLAWAGDDSNSGNGSTTSSTSSTSTASTLASLPTTSTTNPTTSIAGASAPSVSNIPDGASETFVVGNAGTVVVGRSGNSLQIIAATPNAGWASEVEVASGHEVEGDFRNGALRTKYNFELEDGVVRVRIEVGNENNGDDDNTGSNHDDDDNRGPGSGDDDNGDDDDNSGSGSGDESDDDD